MNQRPFTVAMVAAMPYPMAKASVIRMNHIVRALVDRYDDVRVKVFAYRGTGELPVHPRVDMHLVGGFDADKTRYYSWTNKLAADRKLIVELLRHRTEFDLVHCHTIEGLGITQAFKLLGRSRVPVCIDVHGPIVAELVHYRLIPNWRPLVSLVARLEQWMLIKTQQVFVSNEGLRDLLVERVGAQRVSVVFDYVNPDLFDAGRVDRNKVALLREAHKSNGERLLTYLGMFKDYQGVDYLLRAFALLVPAHPELRLALVGDGPCRAQYQHIIRETGIGERVIMPGLVPHGDVTNWLAVSDLVVSPRIDNHITRAGFVSQLPEYMAAGKMIVATWVSGCRHLLRDNAGIVVAANDVEALRKGIEQALAMTPAEQQSCSNNARRNVEQFTWRQGIADVYDSYRKLLAARTG
jgi:glycosyltransferase involved in cell wall biosynthesis